jgi:hypothetical protein
MPSRRRRREERAEAQTFLMKEYLGLSDAKVEKVQAINLKYAKVMDPTIQGSEGPMGKRVSRAIDSCRKRGAEGRAIGGRVREVSRVEADDSRPHRRAHLRATCEARPVDDRAAEFLAPLFPADDLAKAARAS